MPAHEAEALVDDVEDAGGVVEAGALGLALEDPVDQVRLVVVRARVELEVAPDGAKLGDAHLEQVGDVEVVALARGLELLHLVVFADRGAAAAAATHRSSPARPAVGAHGALIWGWHLNGVHLLGTERGSPTPTRVRLRTGVGMC